MFVAALFTTDQCWKPPRCPLVCEWVNEQRCLHKTGYHSVIKSSQLANHENTWMHVLNAHFQVKEAQLKRLHAACPSDMTFWGKPWQRRKMRGGQGLGAQDGRVKRRGRSGPQGRLKDAMVLDTWYDMFVKTHRTCSTGWTLTLVNANPAL